MKRKWHSPTSYLRHYLKRVNRENMDVTVPCNGCNECCKLGGTLTLDDGTVHNPRADGSCGFLIDEKCSIYNSRPEQCRIYDCRIYALIGLGDKDHPNFTKVIEEWQPEFKTKEDVDLYAALRIATSVMKKKYPELIMAKVGAKILVFFLKHKDELMHQAREMR
jgi:Fe-S-cluster containining protein